MMKVHFVLHETFEVPGAYLKWAQERGHQVTTTKVYENEVLPETVDEIDFLIIMGGPQSPDEDRETFPYYDPQAEIELIQKAMKADRYIVGVCLGAQLLSVAYGRLKDSQIRMSVSLEQLLKLVTGMVICQD